MLKQGIKTLKFIKEFKKYNNSKDEIVKKRALLYLKELLKTEGGLLTKFLQYKGTSTEELKEIQDLSQQVLEGIAVEEIVDILKYNFPDNYEKIENISNYAVAASVGQVHFANLSGEDIAIKIQYPDIKETFIDQLKVLNVLPKMMEFSPLKKWGINLGEYQLELQKLIEQECNYKHEARQLVLWKKYLIPIDGCSVPDVIEEFSNEFILTQSFINGVKVDEAKCWNKDDKKKVGDTLAKAYFHLFLNEKITQGDTNHGNFLFEQFNKHVYFIDLGQTIHFSDEFVKAFLYLIDAKYNNKDFCSLSFFIGIGFDQLKLEHLGHKLDLIIDILFEPLLSERAFDVNTWNYKKDLDLLLGEDKWWFRSAGGTEFFLFMKSFMGIKNLLAKLEVKIFFRSIISEIMSSKKDQNYSIMLQTKVESRIESHSKNIKILVVEKGIEKVKLTIPFMAIFDIEDYFDHDVKKRITSQNIDIKDVIQNALADGGRPKEFFHLVLDEKEITLLME